MIAFQLDQCLDSKRFASACSAAGHCDVFRLPPALRGAEDPNLLSMVMAGPNPLVTFDRALAHDHTRFIPELNPGIIVVSNYPSPQTMTVSVAQKLLHDFKTAFPTWHQVFWNNSIVELTTLGVEVWHIAGGGLMRNEYLAFTTPDWKPRFRAILDENSRRGLHNANA